MGFLFGGGDSAPPPPPPPAPTPAPTVDVARQQQQAYDTQTMRKGRAADMLTGDKGDLTAPTTGTKQLLGS